MKGGKDKK